MKNKINLKVIIIIVWVATLLVSFYFFAKLFDTVPFSEITAPFTKLFEKDKYRGVSRVVSRELIEEESATVSVVENVSPAVVSIVVKTLDFDLFTGPSLNESGIGTGFIVDANGLIVTNSHVVDNRRGEYSVVLKDGITYEVDMVHLDSISDLAILEITARDLPTVMLGDSDNLKVGQKAIAIGNALGRYQNTVTVGVISGIGREVVASGAFGEKSTLQENAIQTDAALNPGNSGGPLLNLAGQVVGINVATTIGADNISFAIPVNTLKPLLETFAEEGKIVRPYIGISYTIITKEIAVLKNLPVGAYISRVFEDSPASKVGLERGDIIIKINGMEIDGLNAISKIITQSKVGDTIAMEVDRDGQVAAIDLVLEEATQDFR